MKTFDILGLGAVAVDDLIYVDAYPEPNTKVMVSHRERQGGGLTATALVAASRLGALCMYAGVLGEDDLSNYSAKNLENQGIDVSYLLRRKDASPVHSTIVVDQNKTRTIFVNLNGVVGADEDYPPVELIRSCRVLFVDHLGIKGMVRAARTAREAGIPIVSDLEGIPPGFEDLYSLIDHAIFSLEFARRYTGEYNLEAALQKLWIPGRAVTAVTCGEEGCWYLGSSGDEIFHQPAFNVEVVDTTGCGDVFHGAYAAALAFGWETQERFRFAAAAAALKATRRGGQAGAPDRAAVEAFIQNKK